MKVVSTTLPEVLILEPKLFSDERGFFSELWNADVFAGLGLPTQFAQDNHSQSSRGVLRGLHYQLSEPQGKLVRVLRGRVFDVAVDLRRSSPRFGHWVGVELSETNNRMLWIPEGFGHGFLALEDKTDLLYKCTRTYRSDLDRSILWSDPDIGIDWPLDGMGDPLLSPKDRNAPALRLAEVYA